MSSLTYLTPMESSWWFRVTRGGKNIVSQTFRYQEYGSALLALKAAQQARDRFLAENPDCIGYPKIKRPPKYPPGQYTVTTGVRRLTRPLRNGGYRITYRVTWREMGDDGARRTRSRQLSVYPERGDDEQAIELQARQWRKAMEKKHYAEQEDIWDATQS